MTRKNCSSTRLWDTLLLYEWTINADFAHQERIKVLLSFFLSQNDLYLAPILICYCIKLLSAISWKLPLVVTWLQRLLMVLLRSHHSLVCFDFCRSSNSRILASWGSWKNIIIAPGVPTWRCYEVWLGCLVCPYWVWCVLKLKFTSMTFYTSNSWFRECEDYFISFENSATVIISQSKQQWTFRGHTRTCQSDHKQR